MWNKKKARKKERKNEASAMIKSACVCVADTEVTLEKVAVSAALRQLFSALIRSHKAPDDQI